MKNGCVAALVGMSLLLGSPTRAGADENTDPRWRPWLGCWQLWEEQVDRSNEQQHVDPECEPDKGLAARIGRTSVCVVPADGGITLTASEGSETLIGHQVIADGTRRTIVDGSCRGWEQSEWSRDGHRLFTATELECGEEPPRRVTGVSLMASASIWLDIQHVDAGAYRQLEVRRYTPAVSSEAGTTETEAAPDLTTDPSEIRQARRESAQSPTLGDIVEASGKTTARVVEALLVETQPDLDVDSDALIALDDAGIDHDVIDLLVALSYPEKFVVERFDRGGAWSSSSSGFRGFEGLYDPIWYSDLYPYYVTPLGSRYWSGGYNPYFYGGALGGPFVILPGGNGNREEPAGRAVQGRGYTRVVPRETSGTGSSGASGSRGLTGSSTGGTTATSGGYSSGGSGDNSGGGGGTGRRAVPRQ